MMIFSAETIVRWLVELLVVFMGVSSAFLLDKYRETKRNKKLKQQIEVSMLKDLSESAEVLRQALPFLKKDVDDFTKAYEQSKTPELHPGFSATGFDSGFWEVILQAGGLELLDVEFIYKVENLLTLGRGLTERVQRYQQLSNQVLIPNADKEISEFYDLETKKLKRKYQWYYEEITAFADLFERILSSMEDLLKILQARVRK